jgi:superfamily II DNA or RNA helicase
MRPPNPTDSATLPEAATNGTAHHVRFSDPSTVMRRMAHALSPVQASAALGEITLRTHQHEAVTQLTRILAEYRGALLADDVGLGKTFVALAVSRQYDTVHVVAPATLLPTWRTAAARAGMAQVQCHSLHAWSRPAPPVLPMRGSCLVIIDEAHHLRNAATRRYRQLADSVAACDVLLLSATPVHNSPGDLRALLALFRGQRLDALDDCSLARMVVRRRAQDVGTDDAAGTDTRPQRIAHATIREPQDREVLDAILSLPAPLPAHDGAMAGALIRLGLLRAWCSSDAALVHALTRRRLRGEALRDALCAGRHLTNDELRHWVIGDDAGQLAFPELLATHRAESGDLLNVLDRHLDAVAALARHLARTQPSSRDLARAGHMRGILAHHPQQPVVAFSQYTRTVQSLFRALSDIAGVGAIMGTQARIASGPLPRQELIGLFAPSANGLPPPPAMQRVRLLLTTDLMAEGVNLQDAGVVVHLDLPWTHALLVQREGRALRMHSPHRAVHVYTFGPDAQVAAVLRAEQRVLSKRVVGQQLVGREHGAPQSAADWQAAWQRQLQRWRQLPSHASPHHEVPSTTSQSHTLYAAVRASSRMRAHVICAVVLIAGADQPLVLRARRREDGSLRWTSSRHPRALLRVARLWSSRDGRSRLRRTPRAEARRVVRTLRRQLRHLHEAAQLRRLLGPSTMATPPIVVHITERLAAMERSWPVPRRRQNAECLAAARRCLSLVRGAAAESACARWLRRAPMASARSGPADIGAAQLAWIEAWRQEPVLARLMAIGSASANADSSTATGAAATDSRPANQTEPDAPNAPATMMLVLLAR